jgi:hypothetical protein
VTDPESLEPQVTGPRPAKKWPWLIVAGVVIAAGVGAVVYLEKRGERERIEMRYPIAASEVQRYLLDHEAEKWRIGKQALLATLESFQPGEVPETGAPCPLAIAIPREADYEKSSMDEKMSSARDRDPTETLVLAHTFGADIVGRVEAQLAVVLETADRARFHSVRGRHLALTATALPLIVMKLDVDEHPRIETHDAIVEGANFGPQKGYVPGRRAGTAYVFDKQTGKLRCAGRFEAASSESVAIVESNWGGGSEDDAIEIDFQNNTVKAIAEAVHAVE